MGFKKKPNLYYLEYFSFTWVFSNCISHIENKSPNITIPKIFSKMLKNEKNKYQETNSIHLASLLK